MPDLEDLIAKAERAERLAAGLGSQADRAVLLALAAELRAEAADAASKDSEAE